MKHRHVGNQINVHSQSDRFASEESDNKIMFVLEAEPSNREEFRKLLLESVDEGLSSLGHSSKHAIYFHLENSFNVKRVDIPYKIDEFTKAVEQIFGEGAKLLEILIMKKLHERAGHAFKYYLKDDSLLFSDYVKAYATI